MDSNSAELCQCKIYNILTQPREFKGVCSIDDVDISLQLQATAADVLVVHRHSIFENALNFFGVLIEDCT